MHLDLCHTLTAGRLVCGQHHACTGTRRWYSGEPVSVLQCKNRTGRLARACSTLQAAHLVTRYAICSLTWRATSAADANCFLPPAFTRSAASASAAAMAIAGAPRTAISCRHTTVSPLHCNMASRTRFSHEYMCKWHQCSRASFKGHPEQQRALMAFHAASGPSMSANTVCRGSSRWSRSCRLAGGPRRHLMASSAAIRGALGLLHCLVDLAPPDQHRQPARAHALPGLAGLLFIHPPSSDQPCNSILRCSTRPPSRLLAPVHASCSGQTPRRR